MASVEFDETTVKPGMVIQVRVGWRPEWVAMLVEEVRPWGVKGQILDETAEGPDAGTVMFRCPWSDIRAVPALPAQTLSLPTNWTRVAEVVGMTLLLCVLFVSMVVGMAVLVAMFLDGH